MADKPRRQCTVPGCTNPCHVARNGHQRARCIEHLRQHDRERALRGTSAPERARRAALGLLMDYPLGAAVSSAHSTPNAPTIAPATVKGLVRDGLAQTDPEQNRVVITEKGRQWWLELVAAPPVRDLHPDRGWSPEEDAAPEVSTLAATARTLPPLPPLPSDNGASLAHELALLARLKDTLRLVDLDTLATVPQAAPLVPVLQLLERAG